ncbi:bifunctional nicotinamidase/pyrazinamidase [Spirochaeta cellobiosiphila]|uniref:bifunctional nicotinamidase/pyrazinamidase n=1 Tax=Spirochaeta cellobiosiphila TaxID=504483 RepID=UPI000420F378|nr:bifunctional nicotinamidase/pyrazinamidase [Spirochaeta cellobiosiphila]
MKALIIVDIQNDFCPGGALAVKEGDSIIEGVNSIAKEYDLVITTQDWHPSNHGSFASQHEGAKPYDMGTLSGRPQVMWPDHCVQGTKGAQFHPQLNVKAVNFIKGTNPKADSYSGFFDDDGASTGLDEYLKEEDITEVEICGLATDYCVKYTALDALKCGYKTSVLSQLTKGVNQSPQDSQLSLKELEQAGITIR